MYARNVEDNLSLSLNNLVPLPLYVRLRYRITLARFAGEGTASAPGVRVLREGVRFLARLAHLLSL